MCKSSNIGILAGVHNSKLLRLQELTCKDLAWLRR